MFISMLYAQSGEQIDHGGGVMGFLPIIILFIILYFIFRPKKKKEALENRYKTSDGIYKVEKLCLNCGHVGIIKRSIKGSGGVEFVLYLFFIIPGIIYSVWRRSGNDEVCAICKSSELISLKSQEAQNFLNKQKQDNNIQDNNINDKEEMKKCPFCAEYIKKDAIKCRYCKSDLTD